jgi:hypothetical protein
MDATNNLLHCIGSNGGVRSNLCGANVGRFADSHWRTCAHALHDVITCDQYCADIDRRRDPELWMMQRCDELHWRLNDCRPRSDLLESAGQAEPIEHMDLKSNVGSNITSLLH